MATPTPSWRSRRRIAAAATAAAMALSFAWSSARAAETVYLMSTDVGMGQGFSGDGGPAVDAGLEGPRMIAFDRRGGYYIADTYNHVIRHVNAAGVISTYAGTPKRNGFRDGPAAQAMFDAPHSVEVDGAGNVIVGDPVNDRVRKIDAQTKMVTTIAGTGQTGYDGDGGPATEARLSDSKIALIGPDGGIYIDDMGNDVIRRIDPATGYIETWAGQKGVLSGPDGVHARQSGFSPRNITFDIDHDLIIADRDGNKIRSVDWETRIITTIAGSGTKGPGGDGGPALEAELDSPRGLGVDWMGNLYIADSVNNRIRRVDVDTGIITTAAGSPDSKAGRNDGATDVALLTNPRHAAFDEAGNLYITDTGTNRIRKVAGYLPARPARQTSPPITAAPAPGGPDPGPQSPGPTITPTQPGTAARYGYWLLDSGGKVYPFGDGRAHGDGSFGAVDLESTPSGDGYWIVDAVGRVTARGDAAHLGSVPGAALAAGERVTSLSATPDGKGYWVFTTRGRAIALGDAQHLGDMSGITLNGPVLDSIPTRTGKGYYMVGSDGGIFSFGDARFHGSTAHLKLNAPVQSLVPDPDGVGYWLVASDGGVFAFDADFRGSMGAARLNQPISGMVPYGNGYLMVGEDGGIFNFSNLQFSGSLGARPPGYPVVSVAAVG